jgi:DNA polymerase I
MLIQENTFERACQIISEASLVAVDTETYWTSNWEQRRLIGVSTYCRWGEKVFSAYFPFRHDYSLSAGNHTNLPLGFLPNLEKALNSPGVDLVFHNAKFDLNVLRLESVVLERPFKDTMLISHMINENSSHVLEDLAVAYRIDLKALVRKQKMHDLRKKTAWHKIPIELMERYACQDTANTFKLLPILWEELVSQELSDLWENEEKFYRILADMEFRGVGVDFRLLRELRSAADTRIAEIMLELGCDPGKPGDLAELLFGQAGFKPVGITDGKPTKAFPNGRPKMDEASILALQKQTVDPKKAHILDLVLEFRTNVKARGTWYDGFLEAADSKARLHPSFNQHGTKTTRRSSSDPNMQQLPRDIGKTPVYKALTASPGYQLWSFDYSQLEFRLTAVYADEASILEGYRRGTDFHSLTASMLSVPRQLAKTVNFLVVYGGGSGKLAQTVGMPLPAAREFLTKYHAAYPGIGRVAQRAEHAANNKGFVKLWTGRRRHFENAWEHHKAFNSIVQGGAAEITKTSILAYWDSELRRDGLAYLVGEVHDCLWFEIREDVVPYCRARIKEIMEWPSRDPEWLIPFPVEEKRLA